MRLVLVTLLGALLLVGLWPAAPEPTIEFLDTRPLGLAPADKWTFEEYTDSVGDKAIRVLQTGEGAYTQYWEVQYSSPERWSVTRYEVRLGMIINKNIILKEFL